LDGRLPDDKEMAMQEPTVEELRRSAEHAQICAADYWRLHDKGADFEKVERARQIAVDANNACNELHGIYRR
jgi:hypothetical protein